MRATAIREPVAGSCREITRDLQALEFLIVEHGHEVVRFIFRRTRDYHDAEDLAQETYLQALSSLEQLSSLRNLRQWVFKIAFHITMDWIRARARNRITIESLREEDEAVEETTWLDRFLADDDDIPEGVPLTDALDRVVREVRALPDDYGIVLVLRYLEELTCRDIAALLRISVSSVKVKLYRARRVLRKRLVSLDEGWLRAS